MAENEQVEEKKKKGKGRLVIIIVLVLAVAGGAYFFLFSGGGAEPVAEEVEPVEGSVVDGATMTVALAGDEAHFVRVSFALVLMEGADTSVVGKKIQLVQDAALTVISGYTADLLRSAEGLDQLRADLTAEAIEIYPDGEVMRVVLTEAIVQ